MGFTVVAASVSNSDITGALITGYVSGAGVLAPSDTILEALEKLNGNVAGISPSSLSFTSGTISNSVVADITGVVTESTDSSTGETSTVQALLTQTEVSYDNGAGEVGVLNIDATELEHSWTNGVNGGSMTINVTLNEITHTLLITLNSPKLAIPAVQVGNAGLVSGETYFDTAANILANGDKILARKA